MRTVVNVQSGGRTRISGMVHGVFTRVANKYDIMNDVMSVGIHRLWKAAMMDWLAPRPGQKLLDVAGGTGDVAFRFLKRAAGATATVPSRGATVSRAQYVRRTVGRAE